MNRGWLSSFLCPLLPILIKSLCLPVLIKLTLEAIHPTLAFIKATVLHLEEKFCRLYCRLSWKMSVPYVQDTYAFPFGSLVL